MLAPCREVTLKIVGNMFGSWCGKCLVHWHSLVNFLCSYLRTFNLSHHSLNPTLVHYWWVNNPSLGEFGLTMIGRVTSKDHETTTSLQQIEKGMREEKNRLGLKWASSDKRIDSTSAILSPVCYGFIMVTVSLVYWYSFPSGTSDWKAWGGGGGCMYVIGCKYMYSSSFIDEHYHWYLG